MHRPPFAIELRRVLVLGPPHVVAELEQSFASNEVEIVEAQTTAKALEAARRNRPQLVIVDVTDERVEVIETLRAAMPDLVIGAISDAMTDDLAATCRRVGARWCLRRPFTRADLYEAIIVHGLPVPTMLRVDLQLEAVIFEYIERVISACGSKSAAARVLGRTRQSLQQRLKMRRSG